jgi:hypothetical protein
VDVLSWMDDFRLTIEIAQLGQRSGGTRFPGALINPSGGPQTFLS